jgi:hypothetical protein
VAIAAAHDALLRLSALVADFDAFAEIDLNPLVLTPDPQGCRILDVRIRIRHSGNL